MEAGYVRSRTLGKRKTYPAHILLIEDDTDLCESLVNLIQMEGMEATATHSIGTGTATFQAGQYDLVVLDVMLPDGDGRDLLKLLRQSSDVPIIMLTAKGDPGDRIAGLENGADDYVPKPFVPAELIARIRAVLRRKSGSTSDVVSLGDLRVEILTRRVLQADEEISLTAAEFDILLTLIRHKGECVTREALTEEVLGRPLGVADRAIDNHISSLRKKTWVAGRRNRANSQYSTSWVLLYRAAS